MTSQGNVGRSPVYGEKVRRVLWRAGVLISALFGAVIAAFSLFPVGLVVAGSVIFPLTLGVAAFVAAIGAAIGASWAGTLPVPARTWRFACRGMSRQGGCW